MYAVRFFVNVFRIHLCWQFWTMLVISTQTVQDLQMPVFKVWNYISATKWCSGVIGLGPFYKLKALFSTGWGKEVHSV